MCCIALCFFFFKQKTAYEMRISDWSSDVCSSDLAFTGDQHADGVHLHEHAVQGNPWCERARQMVLEQGQQLVAASRRYPQWHLGFFGDGEQEIGRASCRERVCQYV